MRRIIALVPDLIVGLRIEAAAKQAGTAAEVVDSQTEFLTCLKAGGAQAAIVDIGLDGLDLRSIAEAAGGLELIAFGPHVDVERRRTARAAGIERIYARGKFLRELRQIVAGSHPDSGQ